MVGFKDERKHIITKETAYRIIKEVGVKKVESTGDGQVELTLQDDSSVLFINTVKTTRIKNGATVEVCEDYRYYAPKEHVDNESVYYQKLPKCATAIDVKKLMRDNPVTSVGMKTRICELVTAKGKRITIEANNLGELHYTIWNGDEAIPVDLK